MNSAPASQAAARALARYLRANPHASDSEGGIRRWWLPLDLAITADELHEALTWMKQQGLIAETHAADGRVRFWRIGTDAQLDAVGRD
jgi:hypothetical protein